MHILFILYNVILPSKAALNQQLIPHNPQDLAIHTVYRLQSGSKYQISDGGKNMFLTLNQLEVAAAKIKQNQMCKKKKMVIRVT